VETDRRAVEEGSKIGSVVVATDGDGEGREGGSGGTGAHR